ncbi:hypothetical protein [Saccharothrix stipae]
MAIWTRLRMTPWRYRDIPVDVKLVLCALWITMLFVARAAWRWPPPTPAPRLP